MLEMTRGGWTATSCADEVMFRFIMSPEQEGGGSMDSHVRRGVLKEKERSLDPIPQLSRERTDHV